MLHLLGFLAPEDMIMFIHPTLVVTMWLKRGPYLVCVCQHCWRWAAHPLWTSRNSVEESRTPDTGE